MLGMAVLMLSLNEPVSGAFAIALLTVGPIAAVLGWLLDRRWGAVAAGMVFLIVTGSGCAQEVTAMTDPTKAGGKIWNEGVPPASRRGGL